MTYLEIVNGVLKRLRENQVTTVEENDYSSLVGALVNDAKREIEYAHQWSALRTTITVTTSNGTSEYSLTGSGQSPVIHQIGNDTSNTWIKYRDASFFMRANSLGTPESGSPRYFTHSGADSNGDMKVKLYPVPDATYSILFDMYVHQADLSSDTDSPSIPSNPILQLAYAMALRERGESGGQSAQEQLIYADRVLSDAIAVDANYFPHEMAFSVV